MYGVEAGFRQTDLRTTIGTDPNADRFRQIPLRRQTAQRTRTGIRGWRQSQHNAESSAGAGTARADTDAEDLGTEDTDRICHTRQELARELLAHFLHNMQQLGYEKKEILSFFESEHKEGV